ncbi:NrfD/PsrC family molybdoenzyme membrane anchor subunit [Mesoterricola sediminis]|uniref:Polysulfide reductase chain C n=1 Tax=Mesoterricola sediminis TaxID=2927980 RepID=A0AA48GQP4_9BACT|nr:NrfD/PsrC family molybdoenzyme membrane anchor subunit [Mesoterricola sediminis]BDU75834.1 polysulfide reductase chain C [Mesoterricola sediminis]
MTAPHPDASPLAALDDQVLALAEGPAPAWWKRALACTAALMAFGFALMGYTVYAGIGVWGNNSPVFWAFGIINFVFWVGIGHAGTLISAILLLFRQRWRDAIARFAEAMTIFAVICAGLFPLLHVGRPWLAFWLFPYPNQRALWPNFRSPLVWDVFAVGTYFTVSLLFWYVGLIPDLATLRERAAPGPRKRLYTVLALGWRGSAAHWAHHGRATLLLAGLATALVISVHSVVSFDFAVSVVPGWHMTLFPPYFVAGAIFAGFAMVILVLAAARERLGLGGIVTWDHMDAMAKVLLAMSCLMAYAYLMEGFTAWYSQEAHLARVFRAMVTGRYGWAGLLTLACNVGAPQLLWWRRCRRSYRTLLPVAAAVTVGMWFERFVIIVIGLHQDYLPSASRPFSPTWVDLGILAGSFGLFFTLVLLFIRFLPIVATSEVKASQREAGHA